MIKEAISFLLMPFSFSLIILTVGVMLLLLNRAKIGKTLLLCGLLLIYFFGSNFGSYLLMKPLESKYEPLLNPIYDSALIIVLGGGHEVSDSYPITSLIGQSSLYRLSEGLRLHNIISESKLVLMGGTYKGDVYSANIQIQLLYELAYNQELIDRIEILTGASNTEEEARLIEDYYSNVQFDNLIIVTSARHMTRSMGLIRKTGLEPVAAPTHFTLSNDFTISASVLKWDPDYLKISHQAIHEYLGILWAIIRRKY